MSAQSPEDWDRADARITRLLPKAFAYLPETIRQKLQKERCAIPQTYLAGEPHNVISGEFASKGQKDWAILCSVGRKSSIRIFWGGPNQCEGELQAAEDRLSLQGLRANIGFSRKIEAASTEVIERRYRAYGESPPKALEHQGIEDIFLGKASVILYCHNGKWLRLKGAD